MCVCAILTQLASMCETLCSCRASKLKRQTPVVLFLCRFPPLQQLIMARWDKWQLEPVLQLQRMMPQALTAQHPMPKWTQNGPKIWVSIIITLVIIIIIIVIIVIRGVRKYDFQILDVLCPAF